MYKKIIKWWLIGVLLFLPFQVNIMVIAKLYNTELATLFRRIDVFTIGILCPLAIIEFYKNKAIINRSFLMLLISVLTLFFYGLISGAVNHNPVLATIHGSIDYMKYFFVIFIYAAFFSEIDEFKKVFRILLITVTFIGAIAFIQEFWAVYSRYILNKHIKDIFYIDTYSLLHRGTKAFVSADLWRLGIYRVSSLLTNYSYLGLYCLLIFTIYSYTFKKMNFFVVFSLFSGIFFGLSRIVYTSFMLVGGLQVLRGRKWLLLFLIPVAVFLFMFTYNGALNVGEPTKSLEISKHTDGSGAEIELYGEENATDIFYRKVMREKAIEIWQDHAIWGVGPSRFGGSLSIKYNSPLYDWTAYRIMPIAVVYFKNYGTIDQFWPQVLAELGVIGMILFVWLFISLTIMLFSFRNKAISPEMKNLFTGFLVYIPVILVYSVGLTLNLTPILFTYCALIGIASGFIMRSS